MPIPGISCMGVAGGGSIPLTMAFVAASSSSFDTSTYTFSSRSIGAEPASGRRRFVVVGVCAGDNIASTFSTTVTIAGSSATPVVTACDAGSNAAYAGLFYLEVPTGTTATIVVTASTTISRAQIKIYRVISGPSGIGVRNTYTDTGDNLDGFSISGSVGDAIIGCAFATNGGGFSTSYLTLDSNVDAETNDWGMSASKSLSSTISGQSEHFDTGADPGEDEAGVIAVFKAA